MAELRYIFGEFELDGALFELRLAGERINVQPKVLRLLLHLVAQRARAVSRDELLQVLWPGEKVTAASVKRAIRGARRALGDSGESQASIRTVRGMGYQFVLPARVQSDLPGAPKHAQPAASRAPEDVFVGREGVLGMLDAALRDALASRGKMLLLVGEPGIGKSRTLHEVASRAAAQGADVWLGRCMEEDGAPAFWPWIQVLRAAERDRGEDALRALMGEGAADIAQAVPGLERLAPNTTLAPQIDQAQQRFRFFDSMLSFLHNAARSRPIVLLLDDLQRADQPTLRLLAFIARQLDASRILIAGSCRPVAQRGGDEPWQWDSLAKETECTCLPLEGLSQTDVARLLELRTGLNAPDTIVDRLHQHTAGNPLFLQQIVQSWRAHEGGSAQPAWQGLLAAQTQGVRGAIARHLEALSEPCRAVLRAGAIWGRELNLQGVSQLIERDDLLARLSEAVDAGVVRELPGNLRRYSFTHVLIRDALYEQLPATTRAQLHAKAGSALEARGPTQDPAALAELAHHFVRAAPAYDEGRALRYALMAAKAAEAMMGYEEAAAHFDRALQVCELVPVEPEQRMQLLLAKGEALIHASELASGRASLLEAVELARERKQVDVIARAATLVARPPESGEVDRVQVDLLREALQCLPETDARRAVLQAQLAKALAYSNDLEARTSLALSALKLAEGLQDHSLRAEALCHCHHALSEPYQLKERIAITSELERLGQLHNDHRILLHASTAQVQNGLEMGDLTAVDLAIVTLETLSQQTREPYFRWYALVYRAMRHFLHGRYSVGEQTAREAMRVGVCFGQEAAYHYYCTQVAGPFWTEGRTTEVEAMLAAIIARYPALNGWRAMFGAIQVDLGRKDKGRAILARQIQDLPKIRTEPFALSVLAPLAELCYNAGTPEQATTLYETLLPYAQQWSTVTYGITTWGPVQRHLGMLAARCGDIALAEPHFEQALAQAERANAPPFICSTCFFHALALVRSPSPAGLQRAAGLLQRAYEIGTRYGFHTLVNPTRLIAERLQLTLTPAAL